MRQTGTGLERRLLGPVPTFASVRGTVFYVLLRSVTLSINVRLMEYRFDFPQRPDAGYWLVQNIVGIQIRAELPAGRKIRPILRAPASGLRP